MDLQQMSAWKARFGGGAAKAEAGIKFKFGEHGRSEAIATRDCAPGECLAALPSNSIVGAEALVSVSEFVCVCVCVCVSY